MHFVSVSLGLLPFVSLLTAALPIEDEAKRQLTQTLPPVTVTGTRTKKPPILATPTIILPTFTFVDPTFEPTFTLVKRDPAITTITLPTVTVTGTRTRALEERQKITWQTLPTITVTFTITKKPPIFGTTNTGPVLPTLTFQPTFDPSFTLVKRAPATTITVTLPTITITPEATRWTRGLEERDAAPTAAAAA
jgi:hypothetical protein